MKLLDLFCGAGGAAMGYYRAGFTEIVGIDIKPQPRYPFTFIQADALRPPVDLRAFDFIHASPPCQFASQVTPKTHRNNHENLIPATREMLDGCGIPYVIENVTGARRFLRDPIMLCGSMFGLMCFRHRWFESPALQVLTPPCSHTFRPLLVTTAGANSRRIRNRGQYKSVSNAPLAYGIDWMSADGLREAIPPAYTQWIGERILANGGLF